uniref:Ribosome biogenesis protein n=1 Tax=Heterorhabditis bacteriophora TaxID=37862 RepID=A0A1I7XLZ7_HETBA
MTLSGRYSESCQAICGKACRGNDMLRPPMTDLIPLTKPARYRVERKSRKEKEVLCKVCE